MFLTLRGPIVCNDEFIKRQTIMRIWIMAIAALAVSACTTIPEQIQGTYADISPARVDPAVFGSVVRWGGSIIEAKNEEDSTCFEVLSRDLDKYLRPKLEDRTSGRFIACKTGFYEPAVFAPGREVTLTGSIRNIEVRQVDDFNYRYPVVDVNELILWELRQDILVIDQPYYDPFYYPYYGRGFYGGYHPYYPYYGYGYPMHGGRSYGRVRKTLPDPADVQPQN
jgi:outer membrane lipoprotein